SKTCTVTEHDVKAVLSALQEQVIYSLSDGHSVRLGDLGSFRPTLSVYTFDTPEEVTAAGIKHVRTRFTPGTRLVAAMRTGAGSGLTFAKVSAGNGQDIPADETE
ncbi:MAG: DNA-binding protein, partial [Alloprevotella sp.]|nr:DNA-binding protein [Alloprevotella sp.]